MKNGATGEERQPILTLLWEYCKDCRTQWYGRLCFCILFGTVFYLSHLPLRVVFYPVLLYSVWLVCENIVSFVRYKRDHQWRLNINHHIEVTLENLPEPHTLCEKDYQQLLRTMFVYMNERLTAEAEKDRDRKEYITLWAHQMKIPITAMELLLHDLNDTSVINNEMQKKQRKISDMREELFEIQRYVDMMLQYMRLDTITDDLVLQEYDLYAIVKEAVKYFTKVFISKKIVLHLEYFETKIVTDEKWLLFVLKQILSNALKYTKKGSISIAVLPNNVLVIEDTGIGIAEEDLPRIFERGFTGYNGRKDKKATGIGLYLSKTILDKLNHSLVITAKEGKGTRVEIHF